MANDTRTTRASLVAIAKGYRMGSRKACYDWRSGGATTIISLPSFIPLVVMYTLYEDVSVAEGEDRLDRVIDEAMLHLSKMSMPRREDGYPVEVTPNNFRFAERYFRQSIGWAERIVENRRKRSKAA